MSKTDNIYKERKESIEAFTFNKQVAEVFDDMAARSIPFYNELQKMQAKIVFNYYKRNTAIYDLGCSTGNSILEINKIFKENKKIPPGIIAVDFSEDMIEIAKNKCSHFNIEWNCKKVEDVEFQNTSVVLSSYVLQFVAPANRKKIINEVYSALSPNGIFILSEKIYEENESIENVFTTLYHDYKLRNNYTQTEVEQKAIALENVLIPATNASYVSMLQEAGFSHITTILKYLNFTCLIAIK